MKELSIVIVGRIINALCDGLGFGIGLWLVLKAWERVG